ncbi:PREDICTED: pectinesterase inhibitor-like [Nelumbo nucifera]|uniref:Pectinesterase inhibitor-like n=1 Tax=Nelumbo nucifera TaxID=4432 RepID=A0A1U8A0M3_NELNU|nr:PREDICTED: pectinesterase inhibitor-like [Nelumbo nucifera]
MMKLFNHLILIISLSSLLSFLYSAEAVLSVYSLSSFSKDDQAPVSLPPTTSPAPSESEAPEASPSPASSTIDPAIKKICDRTGYSELCQSSIRPYLTGKTDPVSVLEMAIKACNSSVQAAMAEVNRMMSEPNKDASKTTASQLESCKENYIDAIDSLEKATKAIPTRDMNTFNTMISAVITDCDTCEQGFIEFEEESPLKQYDETAEKIGSICLSISKLLE